MESHGMFASVSGFPHSALWNYYCKYFRVTCSQCSRLLQWNIPLGFIHSTACMPPDNCFLQFYAKNILVCPLVVINALSVRFGLKGYMHVQSASCPKWSYQLAIPPAGHTSCCSHPCQNLILFHAFHFNRLSGWVLVPHGVLNLHFPEY